MRLTKFTHACVRLERDGRVLLIDPGVWTEPQAYEGVSHVLITHEHHDHVDAERLATVHTLNPDLTVYTGAATAVGLSGLGAVVHTVHVGDTVRVNGFIVDVVGGEHAEIYEGQPGCANLGYIVDGSVYHPGDALHVPSAPVETLLAPAAAPWLKLAELIDFVRAVAPRRCVGVHDAALTDIGRESVQGWVGRKGNAEYLSLDPGATVGL
jgi:L-ascorbate metabolism protein UlaG (beta-lactamase superfamily)